jgi:MFS family permease
MVVSTFALGSFYFGYAIAYFSSIDFDAIIKIYGISWSKTTAQGLLTGCIPIGGGIGALASNILIKKFSRRYFIHLYRQYLFVVNGIAFVAGLLVYIQNPYILFIIRIIQGLCVGFYSAIVPVIIK